jgi:hypothetical protein
MKSKTCIIVGSKFFCFFSVRVYDKQCHLLKSEEEDEDNNNDIEAAFLGMKLSNKRRTSPHTNNTVS